MKKFYRYCQKIGASYQLETFGANYFYNAPALKFSGACIMFDYTNGPDASRLEVKRAELVEKYCKRYGYKITMRGGFPGYTYFHVLPEADFYALDFYRAFENDSRESCEKWIHTWKELNTPISDKEKNDFLHGIMDYYGAEYFAALEAMTAEKAM